MAQYTCNTQMALDLMPALAKARLPFSIIWPRPDMAIFEAVPQVMNHILAEACYLNMAESGLSFDMSKWETHGDARPGHTVTGRISDPQPQPIRKLPGNRPARSGLTHDRVEYRDNERSLGGPINVHPQSKRIPVAFSDPIQQARYDRGACVECGNKVVDTPCRLCGSPGRIRQAASVGDAPSCRMTDTEFDSDPSEVGE